ncbi:MAG: VPLPA-CTERM sorting domain-containing protein [Halieaceae bacterium]|jgi:hypothetical protein|nr:VPLPA-CTERM sorting domain-containing protein [Halieaceae bacterium]
MTKKFFTSLAGILSVSAVSAQAGVIDFTQPGPQPLTGSIDGLTYVVTAGNDSITTNNTLLEQSQTGTGTCGAGLSCTTDGFGVGTGGNRDEIDGNEVLTVSFENGTVQVSGFYVLDLYTSRSGDDREHGQYSIDGGDTWASFFADPDEVWLGGSTTTNGWLAVFGVPQNFISSIMFRAATGNDAAGVGDFSVAGILTTGETRIGEVPLPGAVWLMGSALAGMGLFRRRKGRS